METVPRENVALLTVREPHANHHVILAIANPRNWKAITLSCCTDLRIAMLDPGRLARLIDGERFIGYKAVLSIAIRVKYLRAKHQQGSQA